MKKPLNSIAKILVILICSVYKLIQLVDFLFI